MDKPLSIDRPTPALSVVIPLYNKLDTICRAIDSIMAQTVAAEIVIVDDGSTDGSADLVSRCYGDRVNLLRQANSGPGAARNQGVAVSSAALVGFLDADDEWESGFAEAAFDALARHPDAAAYVCGYDAGAFAGVRPNKVELLGCEGLGRLAPDNDGDRLKMYVDAMHSSCIVVRKPAFVALGGYFTREGCRYGEDSYLWLNLLLRNAIWWDPRPLVRFHVEDSALGFAQQLRTAPRPISLYGDDLRPGLAPDMSAALDRVMKAYAHADFAMMWHSGAYNAAIRLGRRYNLVGPFKGLLNPLRYGAHRIRSILANR